MAALKCFVSFLIWFLTNSYITYRGWNGKTSYLHLSMAKRFTYKLQSSVF